MKYISVILLLLLCGCASTEHIKKGDKATAEFGRRVSAVLHKAHGQDKEIAAELARLDAACEGLFEVAEEPAGAQFPKGLGGVLGSIFMALSGAGGIGGVGFAIMKMMESNGLRGLVKKTAVADKEDSMKMAIEHGVKV